MLSKTKIGEFLGEQGATAEDRRFHQVLTPFVPIASTPTPSRLPPRAQLLLREYLDLFSFEAMTLDAALR